MHASLEHAKPYRQVISKLCMFRVGLPMDADRRRRYIVNSAGSCRSDPTMTRGMVLALDDELKGMVHGRSFDETQM